MQLARKYGFSDVWLAKICRKYKIPRPPRGHWARIQSGQKIPRTPLPKGAENPVIQISVRPPGSKQNQIIHHEAASKRCTIPKIVVPEVLKELHPLIEASFKILESSISDRRGIVIPSVSPCLDIRVSKESIPRSLRIMDALIKALESMGFVVSILEKSTQVRMLDVSLSIAIAEELQRRRLKAKDHNLEQSYYQFGFNLYEEDPIPSGNLYLTIDDLGFYKSGECRKNWRDTDAFRLEDSLKSFVSGLIKAAALKKEKTNKAND